ncbi:hypothetical protein PIB30_075651 [Stylosanthes scabra]|uniref:Uncharacterized protein n=1 Tax=Stylosanthes scabra TaxID=79078 RepID=A0ABU6YNZ6_9FABA|nr:hypothetical protein [Stylosanthes scabra]
MGEENEFVRGRRDPSGLFAVKIVCVCYVFVVGNKVDRTASGRSNWRVVVKCKSRGRIESQEVLTTNEAYQNADDIPVRIITDTEPPETLRSLTGEVDIVNAQLPNTENQDESEVEEPNSEDNESASADSISTQDDE